MTNGRMMVCGSRSRGGSRASPTSRPLRFLTNFREEIKAVVRSIDIARMDNSDRVRQVAPSTIDELLSLTKPPSCD
jgi:hypothetical protein